MIPLFAFQKLVSGTIASFNLTCHKLHQAFFPVLYTRNPLQALFRMADSGDIGMAQFIPCPRTLINALDLSLLDSWEEIVDSDLRSEIFYVIRNRKIRSPLIASIVGKHENIVAFLLRNGSSPNIGDPMTPLGQAVICHNSKVLEHVLSAGADPSQRIFPVDWPLFEYPLHCAATRQNEAAIRLLLGKGAVPRNGIPGYARKRRCLA